MTAISQGAAPLAQPQRAIAVAAVLSAMALVVLDGGVMNVALPSLSDALRASPARALLVITAYQGAVVMALLPCGALGERFGYRRLFAWGVGLFVAASLLCALAPSLPWLVAGRFVQGLGGAAVMALGVPLLRFSVPGSRLGAAIGWNALTVALASAAAPTLGALVLAAADWRWIFALNLPVGAAALLAARGLPVTAGSARRLDPVSTALNGAVFGLAVTAVEVAPSHGIVGALLLAGAALAATALVRREAPKAAPLVPLDLLRGRSFRLSVIASVCCFAGQGAALVALPFHLQHGLGLTPWMAGLYLTAWPLSVAAAALATGRLADRVSTAQLCAIGGGCLSTGLAAAAAWPGRPAPLIAFVVLCGTGFGLFQAPNNRNLFLAAPAERSGAAGGMQGTARLTGQTAGALMMTLLFSLAAPAAAPRFGLALAALLCLAAAAVSLSRGLEPQPAGHLVPDRQG